MKTKKINKQKPQTLLRLRSSRGSKKTLWAMQTNRNCPLWRIQEYLQNLINFVLFRYSMQELCHHWFYLRTFKVSWALNHPKLWNTKWKNLTEQIWFSPDLTITTLLILLSVLLRPIPPRSRLPPSSQLSTPEKNNNSLFFWGSFTWCYAVLVLAHGVKRQMVDVPVVLVPRLEEGDHAVEEEEEEEEENESLFSTHLGWFQ